MHHPFKALYRDKESVLMIEKLQEHPNKVPSPTRDDTINMSKFVWNETVANVDVTSAFKRNAINIKLDGFEDHLVISKLNALIWDDILNFRQKLLSSPHPISLKELDDVMIPPGVIRFKKVVDGVPPDEGCEA